MRLIILLSLVLCLPLESQCQWLDFDGLPFLSEDQKYGFCEKDGSIITEAQFDGLKFHRAFPLVQFSKDYKNGICDERGKILIPEIQTHSKC